MGGTFGCIGEPLSPMPAPEFLVQLKRVLAVDLPVDCFSADHIRDSSAATAEDWLALAQQIQNLQHQNYQYFVIIHGTDTLTYAAATLSRLLQQSCHIIFTGSQYPLLNVHGDNTRDFSDALDNLNTALAHIYKVSAGVYIAFHHQLLIASTAVKIHSTELHAFHGVSALNVSNSNSTAKQHLSTAPALGASEEYLQVHATHDVLIINDEHIHQAKFLNIINIMIQPVAIAFFNQSLELLQQNAPDVLILQGYGTGNIAVDGHSIQLLKNIQSKGCKIILDTQVTFGGIDQRYAVSQWVKQTQLLVNDAQSHSDLYAKILKMYLQYPSSDQWHDHWYDHSN